MRTKSGGINNWAASAKRNSSSPSSSLIYLENQEPMRELNIMAFDEWVKYLQLEGGTYSPEIKKISAETENVFVFYNKLNNCKYWRRIMYATVILSYLIYTHVEGQADIISARTSSKTLIKKYPSTYLLSRNYVYSFFFSTDKT